MTTCGAESLQSTARLDIHEFGPFGAWVTDERQGKRSAHILLVEDNEDHAFLAMEAFERGKLVVDVRYVENGVECMKYLC